MTASGVASHGRRSHQCSPGCQRPAGAVPHALTSAFAGRSRGAGDSVTRNFRSAIAHAWTRLCSRRLEAVIVRCTLLVARDREGKAPTTRASLDRGAGRARAPRRRKQRHRRRMGRPLQTARGEQRGDDAAIGQRRAGRRARALVKRGEVRWAEHPDWPRRPALVLTRNEAIDHLNELVRRARNDEHPWTAHRGRARAGGRHASGLRSERRPRRLVAEGLPRRPHHHAQRREIGCGLSRTGSRDRLRMTRATLCPQCVPQDRNQPFRAVIAGQAEHLNPLHIRAFLDLPCHGLATPRPGGRRAQRRPPCTARACEVRRGLPPGGLRQHPRRRGSRDCSHPSPKWPCAPA